MAHGQVLKKCRECGDRKPITEYFTPEGRICKQCQEKRVRRIIEGCQ